MMTMTTWRRFWGWMESELIKFFWCLLSDVIDHRTSLHVMTPANDLSLTHFLILPLLLWLLLMLQKLLLLLLLLFLILLLLLLLFLMLLLLSSSSSSSSSPSYSLEGPPLLTRDMTKIASEARQELSSQTHTGVTRHRWEGTRWVNLGSFRLTEQSISRWTRYAEQSDGFDFKPILSFDGDGGWLGWLGEGHDGVVHQSSTIPSINLFIHPSIHPPIPPSTNSFIRQAVHTSLLSSKTSK